MKSNSKITLDKVKVLLLDIEGTTTPVDFVYKTLFPYARTHMVSYLNQGLGASDRALLLEDYKVEYSADKPNWQEPPVDYIFWMMDNDKKVRSLKSIQGKIWEAGYLNGEIRGELFGDVAPAMRRWQNEGKKIFIYSSGSIQAQRLLFGRSVEGDLTPFIDGYFDTEVGPKKESASYLTIAKRIIVPANDCLFISDVDAECRAAHEAGFQVLLSVRPGNVPQESSFKPINSLDEVFFCKNRVDEALLLGNNKHIKEYAKSN